MQKERPLREKNPCLGPAAAGVVINLLLMAGKIVFGILGGSSALLSDGIHSAADVAAGGVVLFGVALSHRAEAEGRHRLSRAAERMTAGVIALFLLVSVALILLSAIPALLSVEKEGEAEAASVASLLPLAVALLSVLLKSLMALHCKRVARKTGSLALLADARHHKSDAITSAGTAVGIGGALLGAPILDPLTSLLISLLILKTAASILIDMKKTDRL